MEIGMDTDLKYGLSTAVAALVMIVLFATMLF
ncbi:TPA: YnhF family membrane protein [Morganella morganii]|uniref:YnhF family membrane protein n=1 Tax=Morganella morganii TaxID=582 RepID=A0AAN5MDC2_MORMO|nr:YnhF family membrane protein [Morganella morganii]MCU6211246.1 YnhF family membrane protein [Morganella morganii]MCU6223645.1 YnhF family membrane protein [Morganella morganii]MCU6231664.1 YnhF family membrane protein [Morganella morganii]MCU6238472.1 YnhF family membrane protein [Morganella morganii]